MWIGAHVRAGKGLVPALQRGAEIGADVVQIFTQSPRMWKPSQYGPEVLAAYRTAQSESPSVKATFCHATYLINLASPDAGLVSKSRACLNANLATAEGMGADGLVLHIGSHRGSGFEATLPTVAGALIEALDSVGETSAMESGGEMASCPILLENAAGAGDTVGRSFEELAEVIDMADGDERLGVCLDTQHLWASGIPFDTIEDADALMILVDRTVGLERLQCMHLNDSKVEFGANRDRHENIGQGTIGLDGLSALLGHPDLQGLSAILEVPGAGDGPRTEDIATARGVLKKGLAMRSGAGKPKIRPAKAKSGAVKPKSVVAKPKPRAAKRVPATAKRVPATAKPKSATAKQAKPRSSTAKRVPATTKRAKPKSATTKQAPTTAKRPRSTTKQTLAPEARTSGRARAR